MSERLVAMGVDGARAGWIAACLLLDEASGVQRTELRLFASIAEIGAAHRDGARVAIDVPIGLTDGDEGRDCDREARRLLGPRGSSVFAAPSRWMLGYADDYGALRDHVAVRRAAGWPIKSLSAQAHGIVPKIKEVDDWLAQHPAADGWMFECHPEVSFTALNRGRPIAAQKKTADGKLQRRACIAAVLPDAPIQLDAARWPRSKVAEDDLLDAYACLHTALAVARGEHETLGGGADSTGRPMRMVTARIDAPAPRTPQRRHDVSPLRARADVRLRPTRPDDVAFVVEAERDPDARPFISNSTPDEHRALLDSPAFEHLIIEASGVPAGFMILTAPDEDDAVELRRLVVAKRGAGIGQYAVPLAIDHIFTTTATHRFWLDVLPRNARAQRVYTAAGLTAEGTLRQAWNGPSGREDLLIMSILRPEWEAG